MNHSWRVPAGNAAQRSAPRETSSPASLHSSVTGTVYSHSDSQSDNGRRVLNGCSHINQLPTSTNTVQAMREPQPMRQNTKEDGSVE